MDLEGFKTQFCLSSAEEANCVFDFRYYAKGGTVRVCIATVMPTGYCAQKPKARLWNACRDAQLVQKHAHWFVDAVPETLARFRNRSEQRRLSL